MIENWNSRLFLFFFAVFVNEFKKIPSVMSVMMGVLLSFGFSSDMTQVCSVEKLSLTDIPHSIFDAQDPGTQELLGKVHSGEIDGDKIFNKDLTELESGIGSMIEIEREKGDSCLSVSQISTNSFLSYDKVADSPENRKNWDEFGMDSQEPTKMIEEPTTDDVPEKSRSVIFQSTMRYLFKTEDSERERSNSTIVSEPLKNSSPLPSSKFMSSIKSAFSIFGSSKDKRKQMDIFIEQLMLNSGSLPINLLIKHLEDETQHFGEDHTFVKNPYQMMFLETLQTDDKNGDLILVSIMNNLLEHCQMNKFVKDLITAKPIDVENYDSSYDSFIDFVLSLLMKVR